MENEMTNNMEAMTENLANAMPEVEDLIPSVDTNDAEMPSTSGNFGKMALAMLAGAAVYKGVETLCKHVIVPLWYKATARMERKKSKNEPIEFTEVSEVEDSDEE